MLSLCPILDEEYFRIFFLFDSYGDKHHREHKVDLTIELSHEIGCGNTT